MAGYTRNDTANNIADGNVINAADLDGEFDALQTAFTSSTGHTHDGTTANGAPITKVGPSQDVVVSATAITPKVNNTVSLGTSSFQFKDLHIDGTANIDSLSADTADINGGTIDGATIGATSASTGAFTTVSATTFTGALSGNASTATSAGKWTTARTLSFTGDATGTGSVDGSANVATELTLANSGVTAGTYGSGTAVPNITVDAKGRVTDVTTSSLVIPTYGTATSSTTGMVKLASDTDQTVAANTITATSGRTYGVQLNSSDQAVVNVPWTDTTYTLPEATSTVRGGIELFSDTDQSVAANAVTATASRTYGLQLNSAGQGVVNVPWTDTNTTYSTATTSTLGLIKLGSDTDQTTAANAVTGTASRTYAIQLNTSDQAVVNVPWTDTTYTLPAATSTVLGGIELGSNTTQTVAANTVTSTASRTYALQVNSSGQGVVNVPWVDTQNTSASNLTSGTLPDGRLTGTYTGVTLQTNGGNTHYTTPNSGSVSTNDRTVFGLAQFKSDLSNATGAIVFYAPTDANTIMHRFRIEGYLHSGGPTVCCIVQGYRNTSWSEASKVNLGMTDVLVRFAVETSTGKACVILGDVGTVWSYPMMAITHAMFSHSGVTDAYCKDWTVNIVTGLGGFSNITGTLENTSISTSITGSAGSAATLSTARTINGASFNGSANITVPANIATSATASAFKVPFANTTGSTTGNYGLLQDSTATFTYNPSTNTLVAGTFSGALSGNATTATTLATARTINGVSFNGSANITITAVATNAATQLLRLGVGTAASSTTGEIRATNNITAYYSDSRLKTFTGKIENALEKVLSLSGYYYVENDVAKSLGYSNDKLQVGVSAQEVEAVLPQIVTAAPVDIGVDEFGNEYSISGQNYKTVYYDKLVPLLIEAIKELEQQVKELKEK